MSEFTAKPTLAFFGATGGCTNAALVLALMNDYQCSALARTPQKLTDMLLANGVNKQTQDKNLRIVKGDVLDANAVKTAIQTPNGCVDTIISGIGFTSLSPPDKQLCEHATISILDALKELNPSKKPFLASISSTGITEGPRDIPLAMVPLYHYGLAMPHADKRAMEKVAQEAGKAGTAISGFTLPRPSLLMSGKEHPRSTIRVGDNENPAVGYTVNRKDIGRWLYEEIIKGDPSKWNGRMPSITQ